ncbi:hypothetical protein [Myxococcus sp. Y35]|uniref:hypothetical protein n=1 Tax=Pseudomyxococcus flavus TaxID=3115648 RepID=UPI003CE99201
MTTAPRRPTPGSAMLHPLILGAVALLILNDHVFKARWPSWWTGKLSDVAGLAMFPLLLQGLWERLTARNGDDFQPSRAVLHGCILMTGLCFSAIQVSELAGDGWRWGLGLLQWPARAAWALLTDMPRLPRVLPVAHVADAEDLLALPALLVALKVGWQRCEPQAAPDIGALGDTRA